MTISSMPTKILCADLQIEASSKILINNGLYPQKVSSSRVLHRERALPHQWFDQKILPHQWFNNGLYPQQAPALRALPRDRFYPNNILVHLQ